MLLLQICLLNYTSLSGFAGNSVRLLFSQLPHAATTTTTNIGVMKLSLSYFIIRKAVDPSHSLRGKKEKKKLLADCIIQHWQKLTLFPTPKTWM